MPSKKGTPIRNFCIIAHIDHGKSTLADRMLELTRTVSERDMKNQLLDTMDIERERGITIKLQPVTMSWRDYQFNLIDTPGHIDFTYEVSRSLAAVEGALLLVDATQGVEAQTIANLYLALAQDLVIIPVINKVDLPAADVHRCEQELGSLLGCLPGDILKISAKTGTGVTSVLDAIVEKIPPPKTDDESLQALIFDALYNDYKGVIIYVRLFNGSIRKGDKITLVAAETDAEVLEVGVFKPHQQPGVELTAGQIGYVITNIKVLEKTKVGDTIVRLNQGTKALTGYKEVKPMVFAGIYPRDGQDYQKLRQAIYKLKLNDSSLSFTPDNSEVLGFGFRCGLLGLLHLEIFQERLEREFAVPILVTAPTVAYHVYQTSHKDYILTSPSALPDESQILKIDEPYVTIDLITPKEYLGALMEYIGSQSSSLLNTEFLNEQRVILRYRLPLRSIIIDFYDSIKNISSGYASYTYELAGYQECDVVKLEILVAERVVPALTSLVYRHEAQRRARSIVEKLKDIIPKAQFVIKIQAAVGGKIIASERLSALRKDVTAKLYGGDVTRKRKLLEKQKKGKKKMMSHGSVTIPQTAYLDLLKK